MIQKIKNFMIVSSASLLMLVPGVLGLSVAYVGSASAVAASTLQSTLCNGADQAAGATANDADQCGSGGDNASVTTGLGTLAQNVTKWVTIVVGAMSVIMIIVGGFRYITSGGDSGKVGSAKNTIIYAIIGLIIVALAQVIVHFVVNNATANSSPIAK